MIPGLRDEPRAAGNPAAIETQLVGLAALDAHTIDFNTVRPIISTAIGHNVQFPIGHERSAVCSLGQPAAGAGPIPGHVIRIVEVVHSSFPKADIAERDMPVSDQVKMNFAIIAGSAEGVNLPIDIRAAVSLPFGFARLFAITPC